MGEARRKNPGTLGVDVVRGSGPVPSRHAVEDGLRREGLVPHPWSNAAGYSYGRHVHGFHKVLWCISGTIVFHTDAGDVALSAGDRLELPPGVDHSAIVGDAGVECVEGHRP
jgi:hypothetical protein